MAHVQAQLQKLRDLVEHAGQVIQSRVTAEQTAACAYCGKIITDYSKAFARLSNRNPKTGIVETTTVCTETCYRGYRVREAGGDVSYATA